MSLEVICEFGQSHHGDLATAIDQAKAAKKAGAQIAKWQIFEPERLASTDARWYWDRSLGGHVSQLKTFAANGMLTDTEWAKLAKACEKIGIEFCATPFDLEAVDLLEDIGVRSYKIASGDITYKQLIERIALTGKRAFLSTGASTLSEVEHAIGWWEFASADRRNTGRGGPRKPAGELILMACDLAYPTKHPELGKIRWLADYNRKVGYSDHTLGTETGRLAAQAGATVLEKHCTLDKDGQVPDDKMALTMTQMRRYIEVARQGYKDGPDFALLGDHELPAREGARRSIYAKHDIAAGQALTENDMLFLRPCPFGALQPADAANIAGCVLTVPIKAGERVTLNHLAARADTELIAA